MSRASPSKRIRRQPEDARQAILDAAARNMTLNGPSALRIQDVARLANVSHPTVLHYFGSRQGLITALNKRTLARMTAAMVQSMSTGKKSSAEAIAMVFAACREGLALQLLWLIQSAQKKTVAALFGDTLKALHQARIGSSRKQANATLAQTEEMLRLIVCAAFGEALIGGFLQPDEGTAPSHVMEKRLSDMIDAQIRVTSQV